MCWKRKVSPRPVRTKYYEYAKCRRSEMVKPPTPTPRFKENPPYPPAPLPPCPRKRKPNVYYYTVQTEFGQNRARDKFSQMPAAEPTSRPSLDTLSDSCCAGSQSLTCIYNCEHREGQMSDSTTKGPNCSDAHSPAASTCSNLKSRGVKETLSHRESLLKAFSCCVRGTNHSLSAPIHTPAILGRKRFMACEAKTNIHANGLIVTDNLDFGCQCSIRSVDSLELDAQTLTGPPSKISSSDSVRGHKAADRGHRINKAQKLKRILSRVVLFKVNYSRHAKQLKNPEQITGKNNILQDLKKSGRARNVGVSNVNAEQLARLCEVARPACLQVEIHVLCQQAELVRTAAELGVPVVAYSPLGSRGLANALAAKTGRDYPDLLTLEAVTRIAQAHARAPAQVLLRYALQRGLAVIPKSTNPERIKQNISLWDFELTEKEMSDLRALDRGEGGRICDFGFFVGVEDHPEFPFKKLNGCH
ncbi:1,5-anhydro-D-fructose reductase [Eumeta japonica]|uniref:1,5-anhydro-D-fructose reductase n=1 Tax=Eumeta variegata TaxID=151549 RepID=A0A4C1SS56_EUMVA|nr:1,5-anhydro-D-fructose reductase [Eumeta japonica]